MKIPLIGKKGNAKKFGFFVFLISFVALSFFVLTNSILAAPPGPKIKVTPNTWGFGDRDVNTTATSGNIIVENTGDADLFLGEFSIAGTDSSNFAVVLPNACNNTVLVSSATCIFQVTFTPDTRGAKAAQVVIPNNSNPNPKYIGLTGNGVGPDVGFDLVPLDLGSVVVGNNTTSTLTVENTGDRDLVISAIGISGFNADQFSIVSETTTCAVLTPITPASTCTIDVKFTPTSVGGKVAQIDLTDNAGNHSDQLIGSGTSDIVLNPDHLDFGNQTVTTPADLSFDLTNNGANLTISSITATGDYFSQTNNCPLELANGATCTVTVTFAPLTRGQKDGLVTIVDNAASGSPQTVPLTGIGIGPDVSFIPDPADFGNVLVGDSNTIEIEVTNDGEEDLTITNISVSGADTAYFTISPPPIGTDCNGATVSSGNTCLFDVVFTPNDPVDDVRDYSAQVDLTDNAGGHSDQLMGTGVAPDASVDPTSLDFGEQPILIPSAAKKVTLTNTGSATLNITNIAIDSDFTQTNTCGLLPATLPKGDSCDINVTFTPASIGDKSGNLVITDDAHSGPTQTVPLAGKGVSPAPSVNFNPTSLGFGSQTVGTTSAAQSVTLTNNGTAPLTIFSIAATGEFAQTNDCPISPTTLAAGAHCTISGTFSPTSEGAKTGSITVTDNAGGSPHTVSLAGTGTASPISVTLTIAKGADPNPTQCQEDVTYTITVTNTGTDTAEEVVVTDTLPSSLTFSSITASQGNCDTSDASCNLGNLAGGAAATVTVVVVPTAAGTITNTATVNSESITSPVSATFDLTVADVNCGTGGGGCSLSQAATSASNMIPLGIIASIITLGLVIRRKI